MMQRSPTPSRSGLLLLLCLFAHCLGLGQAFLPAPRCILVRTFLLACFFIVVVVVVVDRSIDRFALDPIGNG